MSISAGKIHILRNVDGISVTITAHRDGTTKDIYFGPYAGLNDAQAREKAIKEFEIEGEAQFDAQ